MSRHENVHACWLEIEKEMEAKLGDMDKEKTELTEKVKLLTDELKESGTKLLQEKSVNKEQETKVIGKCSIF